MSGEHGHQRRVGPNTALLRRLTDANQGQILALDRRCRFPSISPNSDRAMAISVARATLGRIFFQRCFFLFIALLLLVAGGPLTEATPTGRLALNAINLLVVVAAVAAVGLSVLSFVIALLLAAPTLVFQWLAINNGDPSMLMWSWAFAAGLYLATLVYLLAYVFRRDVMTGDKLWGAAAAYLMLGVLWAYLYSLVEHFYPGSFALGGAPAAYGMAEFIYFSFTVLTSTGFGDLTPLSRQARSLCVVEQVVGALFLAILIARLAGVYPPRRRQPE